jgi:hypothetical protein
MTAIYTILGLFFVLIAIPFGLMLAPLIVGAIMLYLGLRGMDRTMQTHPTGEPA